MCKMPKVLLLSQDVHPIPPRKGAAVEQWIDAVARRMDRYQPLILATLGEGQPLAEEQGNVVYRRIRMGALYKRLFKKITRLDPYPYIDRVIRIARPYAPQLIHVHNAPMFVPALRAAFPEASLILHMHNERRLETPLDIDCLVGCSAYIQNWFRKEGKWLRQPAFETIRNGVDAETYRPLDEVTRRSMKAARGIPLDKKNIIFVGRISPEKGVDRLVEAMAQLDRERFHLTLVGEWPSADVAKSERARFAAKIESQLTGLSVSVLGSSDPSGMHRIYPLGDLMVIPSRFEEPFSMVAIEAMACGVPVMAFKRGGMVEYMRDRENALLIDPDISAGELSRSIAAALDDPVLLQRLSAQGRDCVEANFTWEHVVAETQSLYDRLLSVGSNAG